MAEKLGLEGMLSYLRGRGWAVAVHNDYRLDGRKHTFWLFTHAATGRFLKGEGQTDAVAVQPVVQTVEFMEDTP